MLLNEINESNNKILIISNNPLSDVNNNGKTVVSLLKGITEAHIAQVFFSEENPDYGTECSYYRITERQQLYSLLGAAKSGVEVKAIHLFAESKQYNPNSMIKKSHFVRLLREFVWVLGKWKSKDFFEWIDKQNIKSILFIGGDCIFAYQIALYIKSYTKAKFSIFLTDDYLFQPTTNLFYLIRKIWLRQRMEELLPITSNRFAISKEMSARYSSEFNLDFKIARNYSIPQINNNPVKTERLPIKIVYAGGLHYNRWKTLAKIANVVKKINVENDKEIFRVEIYSMQHIAKDILKKIEVENASCFCGPVPAEKIGTIYDSADILLHVESFDKHCVVATRYSFSTKIPEYLSTGKCVLGIGPEELSSIRYLKDVALVINDLKEIEPCLRGILYRRDKLQEVGRKCRKQFELDFSEKKRMEILSLII